MTRMDLENHRSANKGVWEVNSDVNAEEKLSKPSYG